VTNTQSNIILFFILLFSPNSFISKPRTWSGFRPFIFD